MSSAGTRCAGQKVIKAITIRLVEVDCLDIFLLYLCSFFDFLSEVILPIGCLPSATQDAEGLFPSNSEFTSPCLILAEYFSFKWPKSRLYMSLQIFSRYIQRLQRSFLTQLWSSCKYKHPGEALDCQTWDPSRYWGLVRGHLVSCFEVNHAR